MGHERLAEPPGHAFIDLRQFEGGAPGACPPPPCLHLASRLAPTTRSRTPSAMNAHAQMTRLQVISHSIRGLRRAVPAMDSMHNGSWPPSHQAIAASTTHVWPLSVPLLAAELVIAHHRAGAVVSCQRFPRPTALRRTGNGCRRRSAAAAPPLALPLSGPGPAGQGTKPAGHHAWGALHALLCAWLLRGSLSKRGARPPPVRDHAGQEPNAGP